jgi:hypothetical protein
MMAKLLVSAGGFDHDSAGETFSPTQFGLLLMLPTYFLSRTVPSLNEGDVIWKRCGSGDPAAGDCAPQDADRKYQTADMP